jgi:membrane-bound lytic murein transglycosylase A
LIVALLAAQVALALPPNCDDQPLEALAAQLVRVIDIQQKRGGAALDYATRVLRPIWQKAHHGDRAQFCQALKEKLAWKKLPTILFTAYHTPMVRASLTRDETYRYPLYKRPDGALAKLSTAQILAGGLAGRGLELAWLADAYDALALHVEGAGKLTLPDGRTLAIGTHGHNGQTYQNVSKLLAADGKMPPGPPPPSNQPGNPKARAYFIAHPDELNLYWGKNPHYVFFKAVEKAGGGSFGELTAGRSIAVDPSQIPLGSLVWIRLPNVDRLAVAEDTGAGIKGGRIDVYFGEDEAALTAAQSLTANGEAWLLAPK